VDSTQLPVNVTFPSPTLPDNSEERSVLGTVIEEGQLNKYLPLIETITRITNID